MFTRAFLFAALSSLGSAAYTLQDDYLADGNFFGKFSFFTAADPTHGFVKYVDQGTAQNSGFLSQSTSKVIMGVDYKNVQPNGRPSVRITSNKSNKSGLFILDLQHAPGGICGTWPAFWLVGPNWPNNGEIDIIEGVNDGSTNLMSMHTAQGCQIQNSAMSGTIQTSDCWINDPNQSSNAGCGISTSNTATYGTQFNTNGGGVYATSFTSNFVKVWFFPRNSIPSDIKNGQPNPDGWGQPVAFFSGCNIGQYVKSQQIVFDTTFCGGNVWGSSACSQKASSCTNYVANNPSAFQNAYWQVNSLKVYQLTSSKREEETFNTTLPTGFTTMYR
ncbi:hypothetical protein AMS68_000709 [Peltaster fructicola]|uniref:endo-1,3(4)-beta-glucanase n=1 Tax=Peltaster fructicola TaxID=286661 RepID=A0A6H0XKD3_9PEZI|nr:hypothetical protein AMS68_000709 [Peltaster fructicola]